MWYIEKGSLLLSFREVNAVKEKTGGRPKKDGEFLNCYIRKDVSERLTAFCQKTGLSKTVSVEQALSQYLIKEEKRELSG